jgi:hypothetical protein
LPINKNELTKEMIAKAMQCETADELMALAKSEGFEITELSQANLLSTVKPQK